MRKSITILLAALLLCLCVGCAKKTAPVPTPLIPSATADVIETMPSAAPGVSADLPGQSPALAGGTIAGFEEGKTVEQTNVPEVVSAVKEKYPDAAIKSIIYATHMGNQVYHVMLDGAAETTEIYVDATGRITPYVAGTANETERTGQPADTVVTP